MINFNEQSLWVFKVSEDGSNRTGHTFDQKYTEFYEYDSNGPNHKRVKQKDFAIIASKKHVLGIACIFRIKTTIAQKKIISCPWCNKRVEYRKNKTPRYRCNSGHEFDDDVLSTVQVTKYKALFGKAYYPLPESLPVEKIRRFYRKYNQYLSIQELKPIFTEKYFPDVFNHLLNEDYVALQKLTRIEAVENKLFPLYAPNEEDERTSVIRQIKERRGQQKFREALIKRYGSCCMITGCKLQEILEAAHINPYKGEKDNHPSNGLLLRADLHTLFDLNLIGINPVNMSVHIHESVKDKTYRQPVLCPQYAIMVTYYLYKVRSSDFRRKN